MQHQIQLNASKVQRGSLITPSESRVMQRKQIQKRLQGLSLKQYQKISKNLAKQNEKLSQDVKSVSQKLSKLKQTKKYETQIKRNPHIEQEILKLKRQLQSRYGEMMDMKQMIKREVDKNKMEDISTGAKEKKNEIKAIEMEIEHLETEKVKLTENLKHNEIDFEEYLPVKDLTAQLDVMKEDNKNLKKKIYQTSIIIKDNQRTAKQALTKIYTLKKEDQNFAALGVDANPNKFQRIKSLSVLNKPTPHQLSLQQVKPLWEQIQKLKQKKEVFESQFEADKSGKQSARAKIEKQVKDLLEYHKKLSKRKIRSLTQLNALQNKQSNLNAQKQAQANKPNIPTLQRAMQTDTIIKKQYRKDWIGQNEGILFDDSQQVFYKQSTLIRSLFVYKTSDHIIFIKFCYENPEKKTKYQTKVPFDKEVLKKMEAKKIVSKSNGFLVNIVLSVTKSIITRVESIWSDGDSQVQGWESQDSDKYRFDIMAKERPIAFFGTVVTHAKGAYALESLGCEILQNNQY